MCITITERATISKGSIVVLAQAVVDEVRPATENGLGLFQVKVWGKPPHDYARIYQIQAKSEDVAARQGIDRFVEEMESQSKDS